MAIVAKGKPSLSGRMVGYARVSTDEQGTDPQLDELRAAGCDVNREEGPCGRTVRCTVIKIFRQLCQHPKEQLV